VARAWSRRDRRDQPLDRIRRGGLFILLGFSPKLTAVLSIMPTPVMGSIVVFVASFMIMSGLQIILSSKQDTRKTFVIGIPLIFGLSLQALPELYAQVVPWLRPLFGSALTFSYSACCRVKPAAARRNQIGSDFSYQWRRGRQSTSPFDVCHRGSLA
jgi:hypothetical protein